MPLSCTHHTLLASIYRTALQADYLVRRGVPFRDAHHVAGEAVVLSETSGTR